MITSSMIQSSYKVTFSGCWWIWIWGGILFNSVQRVRNIQHLITEDIIGWQLDINIYNSELFCQKDKGIFSRVDMIPQLFLQSGWLCLKHQNTWEPCLRFSFFNINAKFYLYVSSFPCFQGCTMLYLIDWCFL